MASVTSVYARAFADVIFDQKLDPGKALQEAKSVAQLVASNKELREVWETPSIPAAQKRGLLDAIVVRAGLSRSVRNFMAVLIDHGRVPFLAPIVSQLEKEVNQRLGFAEAEIISARELSDAERRTLETHIEKTGGLKLLARYTLDPSILGGAIVKVGSTIYDGSIKGQLERIKEQLVGARN
ncbi:MAG TPA: ATP synthase F1 subunit delta [Terriglobales bacterium]|nr:ATP synthase F1 subunit delta [Terriglobales bacterium]